MIHHLRRIARRIPHARRIAAVRDALRTEAHFVPPGHFYSPLPSLAELRADSGRIFDPPPRSLPGIDLNEEAQLALLRAFERFYDEMPFRTEAVPGLRYRFDNPAYSYADAVCLFGMLRHARPRRVVEVGLAGRPA